MAEAAQVMPRARSQRTKLTLADIGVPAAVKTMSATQLAEAGGKLVLGRFIGIVSGFVERTSADKTQTFEGLKGQFRVIPSDPNLEELESGVAFFPDAYHNLIADPLRQAQSSDPNATARIAFQISAIPAKNPAGYSWDFLPLMQPDKVNPLDDLVVAIGKLAPPAAQKQIGKK